LIFIDTSAIYALADRRDRMHRRAAHYYHRVSDEESFVLTLPIVTESCWLMEARLSSEVARTFWQDVLQGVFTVHWLDTKDLRRALDIDRHYADAGFGFADACSLAAMERLDLNTIFTFDRRDFSIYRPTAGGTLVVVP